jgi:hypothetical protein
MPAKRRGKKKLRRTRQFDECYDEIQIKKMKYNYIIKVLLYITIIKNIYP